MVKPVVFLSLLMCSLTVCYSKIQAPNWLIVPGESVGDIKKNSSEKDLIKIFGESNVERCQIPLSEGESIEGTTVFKGKPNQIDIMWKGEDRKAIERIIIRNVGSEWKTIDGIRIGSHLDDIIKLNGKDFFVLGFEWDYAGTLISWDGGNLENRYSIGRNFAITFQPSNYEVAGYETVYGNKKIKTDNKVIRLLGLKVSSMALIFN